MSSWMKNTPPRQVTTPCWLPSQPISDPLPSAPVKASAAGRMLKAQSYLLAGPLPIVVREVSDADTGTAAGSGADLAGEPTATTRANAAAATRPNMAETLPCRPARALRTFGRDPVAVIRERLARPDRSCSLETFST